MIDTILSMAHNHGTCVIFPDHYRAIPYWYGLKQTLLEGRHPPGYISFTKTAMIYKCTHTVLRLWIPYGGQEPTHPMDFEGVRHRYDWDYVSPYFTRREVKRIVKG